MHGASTVNQTEIYGFNLEKRLLRGDVRVP